jgi:short-subunit dehydrogenase
VKPFIQFTPDDEEQIATNQGCHMSQAAASHMLERKAGKIINIAAWRCSCTATCRRCLPWR